jgi:predicted membrane protein
MQLFSRKVVKILPIIVLFIIFLYAIKPKIIFKSNGQTRSYGVGYDRDDVKKTLYTMPIVITLTTVILWTYIK